MPTYEYACTACGERLEAVQSFADAPLTECPACGGALRKVFSPVGVVFKGSGFYKTDSRKPSSSSSNGSAPKPDAKPADASPAAASSGDSAPAPSTTKAPSTGSGTAAAS